MRGGWQIGKVTSLWELGGEGGGGGEQTQLGWQTKTGLHPGLIDLG
jgi:hypothetical protein